MSKRKRLLGPAAAERRRQIEERKENRRRIRAERVDRRENDWVASYEANMAQCLGDEKYRMPGGPKRAEQ